MEKKIEKKIEEKRHKCSICGRVRFEHFLRPIRNNWGEKEQQKTRFGNGCWACVDNDHCKHKALSFYTN